MAGERQFHDSVRYDAGVGDDLLVLVVVVISTAITVALPVPAESVLRPLFAVAFVLFVPGYALTAALFPARRTLAEDAAAGPPAVTLTERLLYSAVGSVAISGLVAFGLNFTGFGIRLLPVGVCVGVITLLLVGVAVGRRLRVPQARRYAPAGPWASAASLRPSRAEAGDSTTLVTVAVLVAVLVVASSITFAITVREAGEPMTEFYLLDENEDGEPVLAGDRGAVTGGENGSLVVGIENREDETVDYTLVVEVQRVAPDGEVTEERRVSRSEHELGANETVRFPSEVPQNVSGERVRLAYLLYAGEPPENPTVENAYREVHVWLTEPPEEAAAGATNGTSETNGTNESQ